MTLNQGHTLVLDPLALPRGQHVHWFAPFVQQQSLQSVRRRSPCPIALLRDLHAATPDLLAEFSTVLGSPEAFELDVDRIQRIVFAWLADGRVNHLFAVLLALCAVLRREIDVLKPAPAADVQAEHVVEVASLPHPLVHHPAEGGPALRRETGLAGVGELLDDLHAMLFGPFPHLVPLDRDRILLPVLGRMAIVGDRTHSGWSASRCYFPPVLHRSLLVDIERARSAFVARDVRQLRYRASILQALMRSENEVGREIPRWLASRGKIARFFCAGEMAFAGRQWASASP